MKSLLEKYRHVKVRDKAVGFLLASLFVGVLVWVSGVSATPLIPSGVALGVLLLAELLLRRSQEVSTTVVILMHVVGMVLASMVYASYGPVVQRATNLAIMLMYLLATSIVLSMASIKWTIGKLWVTLLLVYLVLDFVGVLMIDTIHPKALYFAPVLAAVVVLVRHFYWRGMRKSNKIETTFFVSSKEQEKAHKRLQDVLDSQKFEGDVETVDESNIDMMTYEDSNTVRYMHPVHSSKPVEITPQGVIINNRDYTPLMIELYGEACKKHVGKRRRKNMLVNIVLTNAKNTQSLDLRVAPKGYQRNKKPLSIVSSASLVARIKEQNERAA